MTKAEIKGVVKESLRDWFKKEKWVRISSSGNIAGDCGTSKNKKNPDRCLPKAKAQSLTKGQRAATAQKKKKAGAKGKTVVKNTKKATVKKETKGAPSGHYFTKSGNLVKGRLTKDARERGARLSDPKDKQRSKVPPVTQYNKENVAPNHDGKSAPFGSGYKKVKEEIKSTLNTEGVWKKGHPSLIQDFLDELDTLKDKYYNIVGSDDVFNGLDQAERAASELLTMAEATIETSPEDLAKVKKSADKFAGSDPKAGSTIKGTGFDWKRVTKEDIRNLVVGLLQERQGNEVLMEKDDRCTRLAKQKYDTWPSAYASGAVVRCRRGEIWKKK